MATYKYTAISKDGVKVSGVVEGFNEFDAVDRIKQDCDIVLKLTEVGEADQYAGKCFFQIRIFAFRNNEKYICI